MRQPRAAGVAGEEEVDPCVWVGWAVEHALAAVHTCKDLAVREFEQDERIAQRAIARVLDGIEPNLFWLDT